MKIGIDTFGCDHGQSGVGAYLINFISNIPEDSQIQFELFGSEIDKYTYTAEKNIPFVSVNIDDSEKAEKRWHKHRINQFCKKNKYDVVIFPGSHKVFPSKISAKSVVVLNGIYSSIGKKKETKHLKKVLKHSQLIIAASEYIKKDLIEHGFDKNKISAICNGINHKVFYPILNIDSEIIDIKPFAIKRPYFIYSSRLSSSDKKHIELIKAFEIFKKRTNAPHRLVLAGSDGDYAKVIHETAYNSEYASDIFITGYFPQESLQKMYCGSSACIFPAVNEGVGLPVTEAMACGIPVLCSDSGALKEFAKDAAVYFNPDNPEEIALDMQKIVEDSNLFTNLVQKGYEISSKINWETTVKKTILVIKNM